MAEFQSQLKNLYSQRKSLPEVLKVILALEKTAVDAEFLVDLLLFKETINNQSDLGLLDLNSVGKWLAGFYNVETTDLVESARQLKILLAVLNLTETSGMYSAEELVGFFTSPATKMNEEKFTHTLGQLFAYEDKFSYKYALMEFLSGGSYNLKDKYSWEESLNVALAVYLMWTWLPFLPDEEIEWLCKNCYFLGLAVELPIREIIKDYLYHSANPVICINRYKLIISALRENQELSCFSPIEKGFAWWQSIVLSKDKSLAGVLNHFYDSYSELPADRKIVEIITKAIALFAEIESLTLVENLFLEEKTPEYLLMRDSFVLLVEYIDGPERGGWNHIADYYKEIAKPIFSFSNFLSEIRSHEDLNNDDTVKKLLEFSNFLQEQKLINQDILVFHESDNQFHWNEELFTGVVAPAKAE